MATDTSVYGISAVISHVHPVGTECLIAFASWTLTKSKRNYAKVKKEALALILGVNPPIPLC